LSPLLSLLKSLQKKGLNLEGEILYVTNGGKGIIKTLKERDGEELIHQRYAIHKDRNIQAPIPKKELKQMEEWLKKIKPSAA
jgi:hypothetical protein